MNAEHSEDLFATLPESQSSADGVDDAAAATLAADNGSRIDWSVPLAARLRPHSLETYIGQSHLVGPGRPYVKRWSADRPIR